MASTHKLRHALSFGLSLVALLAFYNVTPSVAFAQTEKTDCGAPVCLNVRDAIFDKESRVATIQLDVDNNHKAFVDDLSYQIEFYEGDELPTQGYLFGELNYVTSVKGAIEPLKPTENTSLEVKFEAPKTIPGGNYFIRVLVSNPEKSIYGITYSKEPLAMTGDGGFLPYLDAALIHPEKGTAHGIREGVILSPTSTPMLALLRTRNEDLFTVLEKKELYLSYEIASLARPDEVVASLDKYPLGLLQRVDGRAIEIPFKPWNEQQAGPYTVNLAVTNFAGDKVVESIEMRLLYSGFFGRMYDVQSQINSYRKGEPLDMRVNVLTGGENALGELSLVTTLIGTKGQNQVYTETVPITNELSGDDQWISFNSQKVSGKILVDKVQLRLENKATGMIYDETEIDFETDEIFGYEKTNSLIVISLIVLLVFVAIVAGIIISKKKGKNTTAAVFLALLFVGISSFINFRGDILLVLADATLGPNDISVSFTSGPCAPGDDDDDEDDEDDDGGDSNDSNDGEGGGGCPTPKLNGYLLKIWSTPSNEPSGSLGNGDECTDCEDVTYFVRLQCKSCGNGSLGLDVKFYNQMDGDVTSFYSLSTVSGYSQYGFYIVQNPEEQSFALSDTNEISNPPEGELAVTLVAANDVINWWVYGPFVDEVCYVEDDGSQIYNISAATQFAPGFCELAFQRSEDQVNYGFESIAGLLNDPRIIGPSCAEVQVTKYLDEDEDGFWDNSEPFLKNDTAPSSCFGNEVDILGRIYELNEFGSATGLSYTNLESKYCNGDSRPYFMKEDVLPGKYVPSISAADMSDGWSVTGFEQETPSVSTIGGGFSTAFTRTSINSIDLLGGDEVKLLMGVVAGDEWPVVISCDDIVVTPPGDDDDDEDATENQDDASATTTTSTTNTGDNDPDDDYTCIANPVLTVGEPSAPGDPECLEAVDQSTCEPELTHDVTLQDVTVSLIGDSCDAASLWLGRVYVAGLPVKSFDIKAGETQTVNFGVTKTISSTGYLAVTASAFRVNRGSGQGKGPTRADGSGSYTPPAACSCDSNDI